MRRYRVRGVDRHGSEGRVPHSGRGRVLRAVRRGVLRQGREHHALLPRLRRRHGQMHGSILDGGVGPRLLLQSSRLKGVEPSGGRHRVGHLRRRQDRGEAVYYGDLRDRLRDHRGVHRRLHGVRGVPVRRRVLGHDRREPHLRIVHDRRVGAMRVRIRLRLRVGSGYGVGRGSYRQELRRRRFVRNKVQ